MQNKANMFYAAEYRFWGFVYSMDKVCFGLAEKHLPVV